MGIVTEIAVLPYLMNFGYLRVDYGKDETALVYLW